MRIETIAEHSVDMDLLPKGSQILDAGCRGMLFTDEMHRRECGVLPIDLDNLPVGDYLRVALGAESKKVGVKRSKDPQATMMCEGNEVDCMSIEDISKWYGVEFWDLIKMDIESAEYEVIMSLKKPPAKQLSIEFHLHTGAYGESEMLEMESKLLSLGYFPVKHDKTKQHGLSYNYWDSLWILK